MTWLQLTALIVLVVLFIVVIAIGWSSVSVGKNAPTTAEQWQSFMPPRASGAKLQPYQRRDEALFRDQATAERLRRLRSHSDNSAA
jgi:hypothetical protein